MAEPSLDCPGIVAPVCEGVAAGMSEHMGVHFELDPGGRGGTLKHAGEAGGRKRRSSLADEDEGRGRAFASESAQRAKLVAVDRMGACSAVFHPADMQQ